MKKVKCRLCKAIMDEYDFESWICPECGSRAYDLNGKIQFMSIEDDYKHETVYGDLDADLYEQD